MTTNFDTDDTRSMEMQDGDTLQMAGGKASTAASEPPPEGLGLALRIFLLAATLLVVTLGLTVAVASWRSGRVAEATIRQDLERVPDVWAGYASTRSSSALEQVRSLATEAGTVAIFADEVDVSTRQSFATEDARAVLADGSTIFLFDRHSRVLARSDRPDGRGIGQPFAGVPWVASVLDNWQGTTAFLRERDSLAVVAAAPVIAGEGDGAQLQGVLAVTFPLDQHALTQLQALTRGEIAVVLDMARRGEDPDFQVKVATPGLDGQAIVESLFASAEAMEALTTGETTIAPITARDAKVDLDCLAVPVENSSGEVLAALLVARSHDEEMSSFYAIRRVLVLAGAGMLLLSLPISFLLGRSIAKPLRQLADGAEAIRDGRLDVDLPSSGGGEVGVLADAFGAMVEELREKEALEDLVADLRARTPDTDDETMGAGTTFPSDSSSGGGILPRVGEIFGTRYKIRSELGRGGMGVVYRASDLELEEDVALKVLRPGAFDNATDGVAKLKSEIRMARRISHQNVIRVHDLVEADGMRCLSMEYVPGSTLVELMRRHRPLGLGPGLQVAKQLSRGLAAVHAEGIVHRDLKPQNVMVLPNGVVKLMDFGISRGVLGAPANESPRVEGTPAYMSPEQCQGLELDQLSDVYSMGLILWEMFAGAKAIQAPNIREVVIQQLHQVPQQLTEIREDIPVELDTVIMACLAKDKKHRPQTAKLVYQQLREILVVEW